MPKMEKILRVVFEKNSKNVIFWHFCVPDYLRIKIFFKNSALSLFYIYCILHSCKILEKSLEQFLRRIQKHYFLKLIPDYLKTKIKNFSQKFGSVTFLHLWYLTFMQNFREILKAVLRKTRTDTWTDRRTDMGHY